MAQPKPNSETDFVLCSESPEKAIAYVEALKVTGVPGDRIFAFSPSNNDLSAGELRALGSETKGLLLCGGPDIEPARYGASPRADANLQTMAELDSIEWELLRGAQDAETPVLGVCRGLQLLNVYLGGTLRQDLPSEIETDLTHDISHPEDFLAHEVHVDREDLPIGSLFGTAPFLVNTRHHQCILDLAPELEAVAHASDGVTEICQSRPGTWWRWAVQWHPENLMAYELQRNLWSAFVNRAMGATETCTAPETVVAR